MRIRRDRRGPDRYLNVRLALFFLASGTWLAGVLSGREWLTGMAIGVLALAILLGWLGRGREPD